MIRIYPSMLPGEPIETHQAKGQTLESWLIDNVPDYTPDSIHIEFNHPIVVKQAGRVIPPSEWSNLDVGKQTVDIYIAPQSGAVDAISSVISSVVGIFTSIFSFLMPDVPDVSQRNQGRQGEQLKGANAQANQPRLNAVIPDQAGRYKKYPDLLVQPVKRFVNDRSQVLTLFMSLGRGSFERNTNDLQIGSTPLNSISGASYQFFEPGDNVSGNAASENWYNAPEVGAQTGGAGLRLRAANEDDADFTGLAFSGSNVVTVAGNYLPQAWQLGVDLIVRLFQPVLIDSNQFTIFGDFRHLQLGMPITLIGDYEGNFTVRAITNEFIELNNLEGDPVNDLPPGNYNISFDLTGAFYRVLSRDVENTQITLQRYNSDETIDTTWNTFPSLSSVTSNIYPAGPLDALWTGPFLACPRSEVTAVIEFDVFCPRGIGTINEDGSISYRERTIEMQYRNYGDTIWISTFHTVGGATRDQLGRTFFVPLGSAILPEVRVRRLEEEDTSTQSLDEIQWYGLRSRLVAPSSYAGISTLAVTIEGSDLIASQSENQINIVETRKLNGTATRSIAEYARYVMNDIGLTIDDIDEVEFDRLATLWDSRGDYYDFVHAEPSTVNATIDQILRAGHAEKTINDARITPVRDEPRSTFEQMYTPQNMTGEGLTQTVAAIRPDDVDGVDIDFVNEETWVRETVECRLPGDAGFRPEKITLDGVTSRRNAWRIGMKMRAAMRYRRKTFEFGTELDALNSNYWSYCALADDVPGYTSSGIIEAVEIDGSEVHVSTSEPLEWQDGETHLIAWREPDGTLSGPYTATRGDDDQHVIYTGDAPTVDYSQELPHYMFGVSQTFSYPVLISSIEPQGFDAVSVQAVNYDSRVYDYDNSEPPA